MPLPDRAPATLPLDSSRSPWAWLQSLFRVLASPAQAHDEAIASGKVLRYLAYAVLFCMPLILGSLVVARLVFGWGQMSRASLDGLSQSCGQAAMVAGIVIAFVMPVLVLGGLLTLAVLLNLSLALWSGGRSFPGVGACVRLFSFYGPLYLYLKIASYLCVISLPASPYFPALLVLEALALGLLTMAHLARLHGIRPWQAFGAVCTLELLPKLPLILGILAAPMRR